MDRTSTRRGFLGLAATAAVAGGMVTTAPRATAALLTQRRTVTVLGGGVGGLTAAQELAERGFRVTVIEPKAWGGKARSIPVAGTGTGGRADLPGEHGFRFFPGFYQNIPDTFSRIPVPGQPNGVLENLVDAEREVITLPHQGQLWAFPSADGDGYLEGMRSVVTLLGVAAGVPANEIEYFVRKFSVFMTSCDARRLGQWEPLPWTEFTRSKEFSPMYQQVFGTGLTKTLVAAKGESASTRTVALMGEAFVFALMSQNNDYIRKESGYGAADRLLDLPTNEAWIDPWVSYLKGLGVTFVSGHRATELVMRSGAIDSVVLESTGADGFPTGGSVSTVQSDWYVCAMPVEQMVKLVSPAVVAADPRLGRLGRLTTDWMNGIQFFLDRNPNIVIPGHVAFLDTPWALTSIDQGAFWRKDIATSYGDGSVRDVYSVDVSDWFTPGIVYGKAAADCTPDEIAHEVWEQMKRSLNADKQILTDDMLVRYVLDPAIHWPDGPSARAANSEPLLINTAGSYADRPDATTGIPNLFLASDYVRTSVDLATMEGANEAGRSAANGILAAAGSSKEPAVVKPLWQPQELAAVKAGDAVLYAQGLPNALDVVPAQLPV